MATSHVIEMTVTILALASPLILACAEDEPALRELARDFSAATLKGCYEFETQPWQSEDQSLSRQQIAERRSVIEDDSQFFIPKRVLFLDYGLGLPLSTTDSDQRQSRRYFSWEFIRRDSVRIVWSDHYIGMTSRLAVAHDSVNGSLYTWSDESYLNGSAQVVGWRIDCSTFKRKKTREDRFLP